jgi:hypothetical protein
MSWRRFLILLAGLSTDSRFVMSQSAHGSTSRARMVTDPKAVERVARAWAG